MITKNRSREKPNFANINLLGNCNANCYFCLGKDIQAELKDKNQLNTHFSKWINFKKFLEECSSNNIRKLYLTGQTADGLQYKYLEEITDYLQEKGFILGLRTNGYLAENKLNEINKMKGSIGYSIHSLNSDINYKILRRKDLPNWDKIIPNSGDRVRISIVLTRYNYQQFYNLVSYISKFKNVKYIQVRRISTDTRYDLLKKDIELYEELFKHIDKNHSKTGTFYEAEQYEIFGKEVNFWRTVQTTINSFNYFTDGTLSEEYFVVEGYLNNYRKY